MSTGHRLNFSAYTQSATPLTAIPNRTNSRACAKTPIGPNWGDLRSTPFFERSGYGISRGNSVRALPQVTGSRPAGLALPVSRFVVDYPPSSPGHHISRMLFALSAQASPRAGLCPRGCRVPADTPVLAIGRYQRAFPCDPEIRRQRVAALDREVDLRIRLAVVANQAGLPEVVPWAFSHKNAQESSGRTSGPRRL
jgi:hypothetical protein